MKTLAILTSGILVITACSHEPKEVLLRTEKGAGVKETAKVTPTAMMTIDVEGMTCEMGCGGSIRKELKGTGGVSRVKFDFEEGRKVQKAYIYFDETVIRPEEIKTILTSMNDKQFTVSNDAVEELEITASVKEESTSSKEEESKINMEETSVKVPNLIGILKDLVVN
jgi:mercuric ion binding protein